MKARERINQIYKEVNQLEKEKALLQKQCPHKNTTVVDYYWRVGSCLPANVCEDCDALISYTDQPQSL